MSATRQHTRRRRRRIHPLAIAVAVILGAAAVTFYAFNQGLPFVHQFTLGLRADLHGTGVRVSCIEPGLVGGTEFSEVRFGGDAERAAGLYAGTEPLSPEDIAAAVEWVTSQPSHVNVNFVELMPVVQSFGALPVDRSE